MAERLLDLRRQHNEKTSTPVTIQQIAKLAIVHPADVLVMELGQPVDALIANRILNAFNTLTGSTLTFADITMKLKPAPKATHSYERGLAARR